MSPNGHLALGFAAKKYSINIPLPILLIAAYTIDLLYFVFIALKMETYAFNPWSHSLGMALIWSMLGGFIFYLNKHNIKQALIIGLLVFSHWILDFIVWDNLPIFFDASQRIGLGSAYRFLNESNSIEFWIDPGDFSGIAYVGSWPCDLF